MHSTHCDELALEPCVILHSIIDGSLHPTLSLHIGVSNIGELCGGVVAPNDDVVHFLRCDCKACSHLGLGTVLVQPRHTGEVAGRQGGGRLEAQQGIGVGRVTHHQHLEGKGKREGEGEEIAPILRPFESESQQRNTYAPHFDCLLCVSVQCLPLGLKDLCISFEQVLALHALFAWHGADHDADVNVGEGHNRVCRC